MPPTKQGQKYFEILRVKDQKRTFAEYKIFHTAYTYGYAFNFFLHS